MLHRIKFIYLMGRFTNIYLIHSMGPTKMLKKHFFSQNNRISIFEPYTMFIYYPGKTIIFRKKVRQILVNLNFS